MISDRLSQAFSRFTEVNTTSVPALFEAAAEHATPGSRVIIVTPGVDQDANIDLNRPLVTGEGVSLAKKVISPHLPPRTSVIIAGVGQVDSSQPAPGSTWTAELVAFNRTICEGTTAICQVFTAVAVSQVAT